MGFAALEKRVNAVALAMVANATAAIAGQPLPVRGVFEAAYQDIQNVIGTSPTFVAGHSELVGCRKEDVIAVTCEPFGLVSVNFKIFEVHPEEGLRRLWLKRVAP